MGGQDYPRNRRESIEHGRRRRAERAEFLRQQLHAGEEVVARSRHGLVVTNLRILAGRQLSSGSWVCDPLEFSDIARWTPGRRHDGRPLLRLDHVPRERIEHVPAHRFLRFAWGNDEAPVAHSWTTLAFGRDDDPGLLAIRERLERSDVPRGEAFVVRPAGSREERMRGSKARLFRRGRFGSWTS